MVPHHEGDITNSDNFNPQGTAISLLCSYFFIFYTPEDALLSTNKFSALFFLI
jgi:hypothetical protein